jgi:hypothetical protein
MPQDMVSVHPGKRVPKFLLRYFQEKFKAEASAVNLRLDMVKPSRIPRGLESSLIETEMKDPQIPRTISAGVIYVRRGQTKEEEYLKNGSLSLIIYSLKSF